MNSLVKYYHDCEDMCKVIRFMIDPDDPTDPFIYVSVLSSSNHARFPFWQKMKLIWKIITTGEPYEDDIILHKEEAKAMSDNLLKMIAYKKEN